MASVHHLLSRFLSRPCCGSRGPTCFDKFLFYWSSLLIFKILRRKVLYSVLGKQNLLPGICPILVTVLKGQNFILKSTWRYCVTGFHCVSKAPLCAAGSTLTCLVNGEKRTKKINRQNGSANHKEESLVGGLSGITHLLFCLSRWLPHLSDLFDFSITQLWILRKVTIPKPSKSVKILKKETKSKESGTDTETAVLSSQHRICFLGVRHGFMAILGQLLNTTFLGLIPQLAMSSFTIVLKVPRVPINAYVVNLADKNSHSLNVFIITVYKLIVYSRSANFPDKIDVRQFRFYATIISIDYRQKY